SEFLAARFGLGSGFLCSAQDDVVAAAFDAQASRAFNGEVDSAGDFAGLFTPLQARQAGTMHHGVGINGAGFEIPAENEAGFAVRRKMPRLAGVWAQAAQARASKRSAGLFIGLL